MKATEDLIHEHTAVLVALAILDRVAAAIAAERTDAPAHLDQPLDFFRGFVDKCHHGKEKENDVLFPMADRLVPQDVAARLVERFDVIERDRVGDGRHEAYHAMLHDLKNTYGVA